MQMTRFMKPLFDNGVSPGSELTVSGPVGNGNVNGNGKGGVAVR